MNRKSVIGKGLDALIKSDGRKDLNRSITEVGIHKIKPNSTQPRKQFSKHGIEQLASSIKEKGLIQPIIVRKSIDNYEIIAGERRWRASQLAGLKNVPIIIKNVSDNESLEISLIENLQRENLNPIEEANAYDILVNKYQLTHDEIARKIGKDRTTITNQLRLLKLPSIVKEAIVSGTISQGHARSLLGLEDLKKIDELLKRIISNKLSVRKTEELAKKILSASPVKTDTVNNDDLNLKFYTVQLMKVLGSKVKIVKNKNKGKIEIEYYSLDDLNRILKLIIK